MEVENMSSSIITTSKDEDKDVPLPGFRFHPTDEELVGFYLRGKVEKRPISIELIKQIDIYKYDPWDLPNASNVGDNKEWYFFCKRGRKYRNSIRPNRVTGSGFWKATGIDKPIYSAAERSSEGRETRDCIGLKKSLVYYRGSAGKGTKTDWMMHEFRLPADHDKKTNCRHIHVNTKAVPQEAEVWTICRIFRRNLSYRKCMPDWREMSANRNPTAADAASSKTCSSVESANNNNRQLAANYISFSDPDIIRQNEKKPPSFITATTNTNTSSNHVVDNCVMNHHHQLLLGRPLLSSSSVTNQTTPLMTGYCSSSSFMMMNSMDAINDFLKHADWDELGSVVELGDDGPNLF